MKKSILLLLSIFMYVGISFAKDNDPQNVTRYCEVKVVEYNLLKSDLNALVDFGLADKNEDAYGWIYNPETNKKMSFASPMSVFAFMAKNGWEFENSLMINLDEGMKGKRYISHFIFKKVLPRDCSREELIGDIDYRMK